MRASMAAERRGCKGSSKDKSPWGDPQGFVGALALAAMALKNGAQNKAAISALDLKHGDVVLDIGCGPGMGMRRALEKVGEQGFVAGIDHSGCAVQLAAHAAHCAILQGRASVMMAQVTHLPFRETMFDKAYAVNSFGFWPDPARALRELARVLAPRGRLVITQRAIKPECPTRFVSQSKGMEHIDQAAALFKTLGWRIIDERVDPDGPRLIAATVIAERPA